MPFPQRLDIKREIMLDRSLIISSVTVQRSKDIKEMNCQSLSRSIILE